MRHHAKSFRVGIAILSLCLPTLLSSWSNAAVVSTQSDLLYVANLPATAGDTAAVNRLTAMGYNVDSLDDNATSVGDWVGFDLILVSSSSVAGNVGSKYRDAPIPVMTWDNVLFREAFMGFTGDQNGSSCPNACASACPGVCCGTCPGDYGGVGTFEDILPNDSVRIVDDVHPIAAGFSNGLLQVFTGGTDWTSWARVSTGADIVATVWDGSPFATIFVYEVGAMMNSIPAPARRVGFFFPDNMDTFAPHSNAWTLFDAAAAYTYPPSTTTEIDGGTTPITHDLHRNEPNPFNPGTRIRYDVATPGGHVRLEVFDGRGRLVRTLVDGWRAPGNETTMWDSEDNGGSRVASGVYFYRLSVGSFEKTLKLVLIR